MAKPDKKKCPFAGKIVKERKDWPMIECLALKNDKISRVLTAIKSPFFYCINIDYLECPSYQIAMQKKDGTYHNCFEHDIDGGVCMVCGSVNHRDLFGGNFDE